MKKQFLLHSINPEIDCEFLNVTPLSFTFVGEEENDSGWCDWDTGARIVTTRDKIIFVSEDAEDEALITLTFGNRVQELKDEFNSADLAEIIE